MTARRHERWALPTLLVLAPLLMAALSPGWLYGDWQVYRDAIDPWFYYGYFRSLPLYEGQFFPRTYYGSRLAWTAPGYLIHQALPSLAATFLLHLLVVWVALLSAYAVFQRLGRPRAGFIVALLLLSDRYFRAEAASDYFAGCSGAAWLLTLALLASAARAERPRAWLIAAGASGVVAVHMNLFGLHFAPSYFVAYLGLRRALRPEDFRWRRDLLSQGLWMLAGALALTAALDLVYYAITGGLFFYAPSLVHIWQAGGEANPYRKPLIEWVGTARWLILPALGALAALSGLIASRFSRTARGEEGGGATRVLLVVFLTEFGLLFAEQLRDQPLFQLSYYADLMLGPLYLALGALIPVAFEELRPRLFAALAGGALLSCLLMVVSHALPGIEGRGAWLSLGTAPWIIALIGLSLGLFRALPRGRGPAALAAFSALIGVQWLLTPDIPGAPFRERYQAIEAGLDLIEERAGDRRPYFWYDKGEDRERDFRALCSVYLWAYSWIGLDLPKLDKSNYPLQPFQIIVIPSFDRENFPRAQATLAGRGLALRSLGSRDIPMAGGLARVHVAEIEPSYRRFARGGFEARGERRILGQGPSLGAADWRADGRLAEGATARLPDGFRLETLKGFQTYGALSPVMEAAEAGSYHFELRVKVERGRFALRLIDPGATRLLARSVRRGVEGEEQVLYADCDLKAGEALVAVVDNDDRSNRPSRGLVRSLTFYKE